MELIYKFSPHNHHIFKGSGMTWISHKEGALKHRITEAYGKKIKY